MKPIRYMRNMAEKAKTATAAVVGGGIMTQFPRYEKEYMLNMEEEIQKGEKMLKQYEGLGKDAMMEMKQEDGQLYNKINNAMERHDTLKGTLDELETNTGLENVIATTLHGEGEIAKMALKDYEPGLDADADVFGYALVGAVAAVGAYKANKAVKCCIRGAGRVFGRK